MKIFIFLFSFIFINISSQIPIPATGCYHSAFTPSESGGQQGFETLAQKNIAIEMNFTAWNSLTSFPIEMCNQIMANGAYAHLTWEPWNYNASSTQFSNQNIINGNFDNYIATYASDIKSWGKPIFLRWGHEMNGTWYPWDGSHSGGSTLNGFGDPNKADGPERYIAAYKRIHDIFEALGVDNVVWIWCPNSISYPGDAWNQPENYYPGDDYVDWIGFDGYNFGVSQSSSSWVTFLSLYNGIYNKFKNYNKPMIIGEFGCSEIGGSKSMWIRDAYSYIKLLYPQIKAVTWFNINKETDWRINSTQQSLDAYKLAISDSYYLDQIIVSVEDNLSNDLPQSFGLENPYPNPFNGSCTVKYYLNEPDNIKIEIVDILGNKIKLLTSGFKNTGIYSTVWNGFNDSNKSCVSGIYFVNLISSKGVFTKKIIYLR